MTRTVPARAGLRAPAAVVSPDERRALHRRFLFAQSFVQKDPWAERAAGAAAHEYRALVAVE